MNHGKPSRRALRGRRPAEPDAAGPPGHEGVPTGTADPELALPLAGAPVRSWAAVAAVLVLLAGGALWLNTSVISSHLILDGVLVAGDGPVAVRAVRAGQLADLTVQAGQTVRKGTPLGTLVDTDGVRHRVVSPASGAVLALGPAPGSPVAAGTRIALIDRVGRPLGAWLFAASTDAHRLHVGQSVAVGTPDGPRAGRVAQIGAYPVEREDLTRSLGFPPAAAHFPQAAAWIVHVSLTGPPAALGSTLTPVTGAATLSARTPLNALLGTG